MNNIHKSAKQTAAVLNAIQHKPMTVQEVSETLGMHPESVRKLLHRLKQRGMTHVGSYQYSEKHSNQPMKVYAFGPGSDAKRLTKSERDLAEKRANQPTFIAWRDPFTAAFFGAAA